MGTVSKADVIVVGGGVVGASIAFQLSERGQRVLLLERSMLGSGSTGRAAGLLGQLRSTEAATAMMMESLEIVADLERRLEVELFVRTGSLRLATTEQRAIETRSQVEFGRSIGLDISLIDKQEASRLIPYMQLEDVLEMSYCPSDGHLLPSELHEAFVRLARQNGAELRAGAGVEELIVEAGKIVGVRTGGQRIDCPLVVNATGPWSHLLAAKAGSTLQTSAIGHSYLTSAPNDQHPIDRLSPGVRDYDNRIYSRPEAGGLLVGIYEAEPTAYGMQGLPADFDMSRMSVARDDLSVAYLLDATQRRFPFMAGNPSFRITHGIMTFTPNGSPLCGELPEVRGLFHCAGFCGHGIVRSPVIGAIMADLILEGRERYDLEQLRADRYFELPGLQSREAIEAQGREAYAAHYGPLDPFRN